MVAHQAIAQQIDRMALDRFGEDPDECEEVFVLEKELFPLVPAVEDVVDHPCFNASNGTWHEIKRIEHQQSGQ